MAKVRPKQVITPADFSFYPRRWGLTAPAIVQVDVRTGRVMVFRWPFERYTKKND
ncbi:MAG: hypothetical protein HPY90_13570 [Syntrophothermus sp.]|uniref:hypothetical protein n=1 Tax=Syntrophothermus sp. TaxID=2736299 RepID=UPI00257EE7C4|nr:hypothetical protein [Syntrophothermus sp.]NSW84274.1 hypothetical protein [Syntrophothermus sp.]